MILSRELGKRIWGGSTNMENGGGGVSSDYIAGLLAGYATESWVDEHYISIDFFSRLFQAHGTENGSEIDVMPNDMETVITSVESMFGFWTNLYISALGSNGAAPAGISLGMLTDVNITGTPSAGQVLTFDVVTQKWVNGNAQAGASSLATLTDVLLSSPSSNQILIYDSVNQRWVNSPLKTVNGYSLIGSGNIDATGGGTGNYVAKAGDTMTGRLNINCDPHQIRLYAHNQASIAFAANTSADNGNFAIGSNIYSNTEGARFFIYDNYYNDIILSIQDDRVAIGANGASMPDKFYVGGSVFHGGYTTISSGSTSNALRIKTSGTQASILFASYNNSQTDGQYVVGSYYESSRSRPYFFIWDNYTLNQVFHLENNALGINYGAVQPPYTLCVGGTIYATGAITALSDARKKDITGEVGVTVEQIAHAPAVQFLWKDKERRKDGQQVGTLAQYWQTVLPEVVSDKGGELSMQYGVAALVSAIITARKVVDHERRITELEKENERLSKELWKLKFLN